MILFYIINTFSIEEPIRKILPEIFALNIIRTSPDHGTAYDLINTKKASDKSLINSFILAENIYQNRLRYKIAAS